MRFDHPWPGVPHDMPHPFARLGPIAMNRTVVAGGLFRTVGADVELTVGVIDQFRALNTQAFSIMVVGAIHLHHHANGLAFSQKSSTHRLLQQSSAPIESLWYGASNSLPPPPGAFSFLISRYLELRTAFGRRDAPSPASGRWPAIPDLGHLSLPPAGSRPRLFICRAFGARGSRPHVRGCHPE